MTAWPGIPKGTSVLTLAEQSSKLSEANPLWCCKLGVAFAWEVMLYNHMYKTVAASPVPSPAANCTNGV